MDTIRIDIDKEKNEIKVYNNGKGIPIIQHKDEKMFVPTMIFGHLLTSSNFNDEEEKVTGGRNGFGAKLCNVFSKKFVVETGTYQIEFRKSHKPEIPLLFLFFFVNLACKEYKKQFKQSWGENMSKAGEPKVKEFDGGDFTRVTFQPDLLKFNMETLDDNTIALLSR